MLKTFIDRSSKFIEGNKVSGIIIALMTFLIVVLFSLTETYEIFELKLYDIRFGLKPPVNEWDRLAFVDIDENSITNLGQFPWPRVNYGTGTRALSRLGATLCAYDIMFPDHSPSQLNSENYVRLLQKIQEKKALTAEEYDSIILNNDGNFAHGLEVHGNAILSYTFSAEPLSDIMQERLLMPQYQQAIEIFNSKATVRISDEEARRLKDLESSDTVSISYPIPEFMMSAHNFGFVNRYTDIDGTIRKVRLVHLLNGRLYFNLALVILADICGVPLNKIEINPGKDMVLKNALIPLTHEKKDLVIPIDQNGMMYVNWAGKDRREDTFHLVPYYALLDYNDYAEAVHDFFRRTEKDRGQSNLKRLSAELTKNRNRYPLAKTTEERIKIWNTIQSIKKNISAVKNSYADIIKKEIQNLENSPDLKTDPRLREELELMKDDYAAIDLVIKLENLLADNITITGLTATGTHDIGIIPLTKEYAGVGVYHNTVNTIINQAFINRSPSWLNYCIMFIIAFFMGIAIQRMSAKMSILTIVVSMVLLNTANILLFMYVTFWIDQLGLSLSLLLPSLSIAGIKFLKEESQKRFIKNAFAHYLAPGVIDQIIEHPESLELGGEDRTLTIFFSDVAKFSTISEKLSPKELVNLLNEYLSEMTDIILSHGGTVDKYEGDAIMAFFGAPHPFEDHALRCCLAAIDQKKRLRELQEKWKKEGKDELLVRMGMNTGLAVVGNMGSRSRMDYTVMGDSVNLASRLEGANKAYSTYALISQTTYEAAKDSIEARRLDIVRVVGKQEAITIYELLGRKGMLPQKMYDMLELYYNGLDLFEKRQWKRAVNQFNKAREVIDDDGPTQTYINRCNEFIKKPPAKSWDGVYSFKSK